MRQVGKATAGLGRLWAAAGLLALAACASGEAAPAASNGQRQQHALMRGYSCTQAPIAGRYSCARSVDREARRRAAAAAPESCPSCGPVRQP